jgi:hypothetical protein
MSPAGRLIVAAIAVQPYHRAFSAEVPGGRKLPKALQ